MKSIKSTIINTPWCPVQIVTFKEFIRLIPRKEWYTYSDKAGFYRRKTVETNFFEYETVFTHLTNVPVTKEELINSLSIKSLFKSDLIEMVHDITTESAYEMGVPTHIVRLDKRFWMAANPKDFVIFFNHNGSAVANLHPKKSIVWIIDKKD